MQSCRILKICQVQLGNQDEETGLCAISNDHFMLGSVPKMVVYGQDNAMVSFSLHFTNLQLPLENLKNNNSQNVCLSQICENIFPQKCLLTQYKD